MQRNTGCFWGKTLHTVCCRFQLLRLPSHRTDQWFPSCQTVPLELLRLQARRQEHQKRLHEQPPGTTAIRLGVQQFPCRQAAGVQTLYILNDSRESLELWCSRKHLSNHQLVWCDNGCHLELYYFCGHKAANERQAWLKRYTCRPVCTKLSLANFLEGFDELMHHHCFHSLSKLSHCKAWLAKIFEQALHQRKKLMVLAQFL